ncbi:MAG: hypothetical protein AAGD28_15320 [Bacteroidota bacterium]
MKHLLFSLIMVVPFQLSAQIAGTYTLIVDERASSIRFEENQSFRYVPSSKSDFVGTGKFKLHGDTLSLSFDAYADPEIQDCSGYEVAYDNSYSHPDSINFELEIFDCESKKLIPFCSIHFLDDEVDSMIGDLNGFKYNKTIYTGANEEVNFRLSTKMIRNELAISSQEYNKVKFLIPDDARSIKLNIYLQVDYYRTNIEGGTQQYLIEKKKKRYFRTRQLLNKDSFWETVFFLQMGKNQDKIKFPRAIKKYYNISPIK